MEGGAGLAHIELAVGVGIVALAWLFAARLLTSARAEWLDVRAHSGAIFRIVRCLPALCVSSLTSPSRVRSVVALACDVQANRLEIILHV